MSVQDFGRVADIYDATRSLPEEEMRLVLEAISGVIPSRARVVDVGVGTGRFAKPMQSRGFEVVGLDVSREMTAKAREKGFTGLVFADIRKVPFRDDSFEAALLVHVLHLVSDWAAVVREAARVSRGNVVSVIETGKKGGRRQLRDEYSRMRAREGFPLDHLRKGEEELLRAVPPDRTIAVVEAERVGSADDEILHLARRGQSITWGVPEDVHEKIIAYLTQKYGGTTLLSRMRIGVAVWSSVRLRRELPPEAQKG